MSWSKARGISAIFAVFITSRGTSAYHVKKEERQPPSIIREHTMQPHYFTRRRFGEVATVGAVGLLSTTPPSAAMYTDPKSGIALPDEGEIESAIPMDWSNVENPFLNADAKSLFGRLDASPDSIFYTDPRFVEHVDEGAVQIMTNYISENAISKGDSVLDLCSSWTSHITTSKAKELNRVVGLRMNSKQLEANIALTESTVQDLNSEPTLPYQD